MHALLKETHIYVCSRIEIEQKMSAFQVSSTKLTPHGPKQVLHTITNHTAKDLMYIVYIICSFSTMKINSMMAKEWSY